MNNIFIFQPSDYLINYYKFMIEQIDDSCEIIGVRGLQEFAQNNADLLSKISNAKLIVINYEMPGSDQLIDLIAGSGTPTSTVVTFKEDLFLEEYKRSKSYMSNIELFSYESSPFNFSSSVEKLFKFQTRRQGAHEKFMQVKVEYFSLFDEAYADVYVRLSEQKFVKILRRFEAYSPQDIVKYVSKGVERFYVKNSDYQAFMKQILEIKIGKADKLLQQDTQSAIVPTKCHEAVYEMVNSIGLDKNCVRIAGEALNSTMDLIEKSSLTTLLAELLEGNSFVSEHSMMLSFLAGGICRNTDWYSHENMMRLTMAAFFHDLKCSDEVVARISSLNDPIVAKLDLTQRNMLENHIPEAVALVSEIGGIPSGVDRILLAHHERYDGSGFPRGLDYQNIDPLSAIFIVSHELVDVFYNVGFYRDNIFEVLTTMKENYSRGPFQKVVDGLIVALGAGDYFS